MVQVHVFNSAGQLVGPVEQPKLTLTDAQWRERLSPEQFRVLRSSGTERPFCGTLLDNKLDGTYACRLCGLPLFSSKHKFNSGTGWPSFYTPFDKAHLKEIEDTTYGMRRVEIRCARCGRHQGHVFPDGPPPTGQRYCLNSPSLEFFRDGENIPQKMK